MVCSGAGAAAIACLNQLLDLGLKRENVTVCDSKGVIYKTREDKDRMDESKQFYAIEDNGQRVLADAVKGKDIFLGLSGANLLTPEMLNTMNAKSIVFAMATRIRKSCRRWQKKPVRTWSSVPAVPTSRTK